MEVWLDSRNLARARGEERDQFYVLNGRMGFPCDFTVHSHLSHFGSDMSLRGGVALTTHFPSCKKKLASAANYGRIVMPARSYRARLATPERPSGTIALQFTHGRNMNSPLAVRLLAVVAALLLIGPAEAAIKTIAIRTLDAGREWQILDL